MEKITEEVEAPNHVEEADEGIDYEMEEFGGANPDKDFGQRRVYDALEYYDGERIVNILCQLASGERILIDIQSARQPNFNRRIVYHDSKIFANFVISRCYE